MENVKILIVDDEILIAEDLKDILGNFGFKKTALAHDKNTALETIKEFSPDIVLLDIRMETELDGLYIGEYINEKLKIPFIYITAHSDIAMVKEIVKTKPSGYITKPFKKSDLLANITMAYQNIQTKNLSKSKLAIKDGYETVIIDFNDINYIEAEGNYINIFCINKKLVSRQSIDSVLRDLDEASFFRIQRSYIVNLTKVARYSKKDLLIGEITLPISKNSIDEFEIRMMQKR